MKRVVVTGGSGKAGRAVVRDLVEHDYDVINLDVVHPAQRVSPTLIVDLTDFGQTIEALRGAAGVVHLAAIPAPGMRTVEQTFRINMTSTWNIFSAAAQLKMERVVWASSETVLGLPFGALHARNLLDDTATSGPTQPPDYAPIDEAHPLRPNSSYSMSKVLGEEMARQFARWTGMPFIGLRFSNIMEPPDYETFPTVWKDPHLREWNLWGYVDTRDVAQSCRLGLTADVSGAEAFIIAAADTAMNRPSREVMAEFFPGVPLRDGADGTKTLLAIDKARTMLGYAPAHSWRDTVHDQPSAAGAPAAATRDTAEAS
jgi:nucleoside-diphosphate-sugar epimerase